METLKADLKLGELYTKKELSTILNDPNIEIVREGIYTSNRLNQMLLFVDLVKKGKEARFHFNDYFEEELIKILGNDHKIVKVGDYILSRSPEKE